MTDVAVYCAAVDPESDRTLRSSDCVPLIKAPIPELPGSS